MDTPGLKRIKPDLLPRVMTKSREIKQASTNAWDHQSINPLSGPTFISSKSRPCQPFLFIVTNDNSNNNSIQQTARHFIKSRRCKKKGHGNKSYSTPSPDVRSLAGTGRCPPSPKIPSVVDLRRLLGDPSLLLLWRRHVEGSAVIVLPLHFWLRDSRLSFDTNEKNKKEKQIHSLSWSSWNVLPFFSLRFLYISIVYVPASDWYGNSRTRLAARSDSRLDRIEIFFFSAPVLTISARSVEIIHPRGGGVKKNEIKNGSSCGCSKCLLLLANE